MQKNPVYKHFYSGTQLTATLAIDNSDGQCLVGLAVPRVDQEPVITKKRGREIATGRLLAHGDVVQVPNRKCGRVVYFANDGDILISKESSLKALVEGAIAEYVQKYADRTGQSLTTPTITEAGWVRALRVGGN